MQSNLTNDLRMRPVYQWVTAGPPEEFIERLNQLVSFDPAVDIRCRTRHAVLSIPVEARHTWSPMLDIDARPHGDGTHIFARMGPEPPVWTFFVFLYAITGFPSLMATMLGLVQLSMGDPAWGLLAMPIALCAWGLTYGASFVGKGLSATQIHQLLAVVEANLSVDAEPVYDAAGGGSS